MTQFGSKIKLIIHGAFNPQFYISLRVLKTISVSFVRYVTSRDNKMNMRTFNDENLWLKHVHCPIVRTSELDRSAAQARPQLHVCRTVSNGVNSWRRLCPARDVPLEDDETASCCSELSVTN